MRSITCFLSVAAILVILGTDNRVLAAPHPCLLQLLLSTPTTTTAATTTAAATTAATTTTKQSPILKTLGALFGKPLLLWEPPSASENIHPEVELISTEKENSHAEIETTNKEPVTVSPKYNPPEFKNPFEDLVTNYFKFIAYVLTY